MLSLISKHDAIHKLEVYYILHCRHSRTKLWPQVTYRKFCEVWMCCFDICEQTDRQTYRKWHRQTYRHAHCNTSHSYWGKVITPVSHFGGCSWNPFSFSLEMFLRFFCLLAKYLLVKICGNFDVCWNLWTALKTMVISQFIQLTTVKQYDIFASKILASVISIHWWSPYFSAFSTDFWKST